MGGQAHDVFDTSFHSWLTLELHQDPFDTCLEILQCLGWLLRTQGSNGKFVFRKKCAWGSNLSIETTEGNGVFLMRCSRLLTLIEKVLHIRAIGKRRHTFDFDFN